MLSPGWSPGLAEARTAMWPPSELLATEEWRWGGRTRSEEKSKMVVLLGVQLIASGHLKLIPSLDQMPGAAALGQLPGRWI